MKRTRLNRRSRKNSRNVENEDVRLRYRFDNDSECELSPVLPWGCESDDGQGWHDILKGYRIDPRRRNKRMAASEVHHICGGPNRPDCVSNLIVVSKPAHDWLHKHLKVGRMVCWYVKYRKDEFDRDEIREFWGRDPIGVIEYLDVHEWPWLEGMQRVMVEAH